MAYDYKPAYTPSPGVRFSEPAYGLRLGHQPIGARPLGPVTVYDPRSESFSYGQIQRADVHLREPSNEHKPRSRETSHDQKQRSSPREPSHDQKQRSSPREPSHDQKQRSSPRGPDQRLREPSNEQRPRSREPSYEPRKEPVKPPRMQSGGERPRMHSGGQRSEPQPRPEIQPNEQGLDPRSQFRPSDLQFTPRPGIKPSDVRRQNSVQAREKQFGPRGQFRPPGAPRHQGRFNVKLFILPVYVFKSPTFH